jgi:hypothetical protein
MSMTKTDTLNYRGELFLIGANQTPLLTMLGGLGGGLRSSAFTFPTSQSFALAAATQDVQSEDASVADGTPITTDRAQDYNVCQIMKKDVKVSFKKQSTYGNLSGINTLAGAPVRSELSFQKQAQLLQLAKDIEFSFIQGTYVAENVTSTAVATRGILAASTVNGVVAAGAKLCKEMIDELVRKMVEAGAIFQNCVLIANAYDIQNISDIYGYQPTDRSVGGLAIKTIITDFVTLGVVWDPAMPTGSIAIVELSVMNPVFVPVTFDGEDFVYSSEGADVLWVPTALTNASKGGFLYTQIGLDYGPRAFHGKITGLATV